MSVWPCFRTHFILVLQEARRSLNSCLCLSLRVSVCLSVRVCVRPRDYLLITRQRKRVRGRLYIQYTKPLCLHHAHTTLAPHLHHARTTPRSHHARTTLTPSPLPPHSPLQAQLPCPSAPPPPPPPPPAPPALLPLPLNHHHPPPAAAASLAK